MADHLTSAPDSTYQPGPSTDLHGDAPPPLLPEKASIVEDFVDIFYAPSAVFARREHGSFWIPALTVGVFLGLLFYANQGVMRPMMDAEFQRQMQTVMAANPQIKPEMLEGMRGAGEKWAMVGAFLFAPIGMLLVGLALWVVGKFVDARQSLHAAIVVAAYAFVPRVVEAVLVSVQGLLFDTSTFTSRYSFTLGVGRFLDPDTASPIVLAFAGRLDVITLWVTVLLAIGLSVTGRIPRARAAIAAAIVWVLGALPALFGALRQG
jgi:hypothetical protein